MQTAVRSVLLGVLLFALGAILFAVRGYLNTGDKAVAGALIFVSLVLQLVALWILRYPKQFLELLGLVIAHFREPTSLKAGAPRCFLRLNVCFSGLLVGSGGLLCLLGGSSVLVFRLPCLPVQELMSELGSRKVRLPD